MPPVTSFRQKFRDSRVGRARRASFNKMIAKKKRQRKQRQARARAAPPVRRKKLGATMSKSAGRFPKGTKKLTSMDYFGRKGVVIAGELGGVLDDTVAPYSQSMAVGHASYTCETVYWSAALAVTKMLFQKSNMKVVEFKDVIIPPNKGPGIVGLHIRPTLNTVNVVNTLSLVAGTTTFVDVAQWLVNQFKSFNPSSKFTRLTFEKQHQNVTGNTSGSTILADFDMTKCKLDFYSKSALKIQNRTVSSANNNEEDDVDNVPLYGKSYYGKGNWCAHKITENEIDLFTPNLSNYHQTFSALSIWNPVWTKRFEGSPSTSTTTGVSTSLQEPQPRSAYTNVKYVGKAHLDPGHIKTSVLYDRSTIYLNSLIRQIQFVGANIGDQNGLNLGNFRMYHFERMIQAVELDESNSIKLAFEVDCKVGCAAVCPSRSYTNYIMDQCNVKAIATVP